MSEHERHASEAPSDQAIFPPTVATVLTGMLPAHPVIQALGPKALSDVVTRVFFASLQTEEREHHPLHVALTGRVSQDPVGQPPLPGWKPLWLRTPCSCTTRNLLRLARAAPSDRMFLMVAALGHGEVALTGLAREGFGPDDGGVIQLRALEPGSLEVWVSDRLVLEYARGTIQAAPEDVLLSSGLVRAELLALAYGARAPSGYIAAISSIVRQLADHEHGGILVLSDEDELELPQNAAFALRSDTHLWDVLHQLDNVQDDASGEHAAQARLLRAVLRTEIEHTVAEVGSLTALDGATILDRRLGVQAFGIVLPVKAELDVVEMLDAAGTQRRSFPLDQFGARHRAAASYAATHPGSLVFIASISGAMGCMLREHGSTRVLLWRFKSGDLASPTP